MCHFNKFDKCTMQLRTGCILKDNYPCLSGLEILCKSFFQIFSVTLLCEGAQSCVLLHKQPQFSPFKLNI